jgi:hypothetical protein
MRTPILAAVSILVLGTALFLVLATSACSGDAKSSTDAGYADLGSGDDKAALAHFDEALGKIGADTHDADYLRAALGRCQALAHVDPKKATTEFIALAGTQKGHIVEGDFSLIANELLRVDTNESRMAAIDVMVAGNTMFPESTKLKKIGDAVMASAERAHDPESIKRCSSMGYGGGGR